MIMKSILAVDVSVNFFDFLKNQMSFQQITLEFADSAKNAYTKMSSLDPQLIIIDIDVNLSAVMEFLKRKLSDPNAKSIPMLISSKIFILAKILLFSSLSPLKIVRSVEIRKNAIPTAIIK